MFTAMLNYSHELCDRRKVFATAAHENRFQFERLLCHHIGVSVEIALYSAIKNPVLWLGYFELIDT